MKKVLFPIVMETEKKLPLFLATIGPSGNRDHVLRPKGYTSHQILYCVKGKGILLIGGNEYEISENMGFFFRIGVPHEYYTVVEPWSTYWLTFDGYVSIKLMDDLGMGTFEVFDVIDPDNLDKLYFRIYDRASLSDQFRGFKCSSMLYELLLELHNLIDIGDSKSKSRQYDQLLPVISYIEKNYMRDLTLEELSQVIDITPQHLCRIFKQTLNIRPFVYITKHRLQKAKELLTEQSDLSVKCVSSEIGYKDTSYFCAIFKKYENVTPSEFRKMFRMS